MTWKGVSYKCCVKVLLYCVYFIVFYDAAYMKAVNKYTAEKLWSTEKLDIHMDIVCLVIGCTGQYKSIFSWQFDVSTEEATDSPAQHRKIQP